jgi:hypothetical protein
MWNALQIFVDRKDQGMAGSTYRMNGILFGKTIYLSEFGGLGCRGTGGTGISSIHPEEPAQ